jgi:hypothetical protein
MSVATTGLNQYGRPIYSDAVLGNATRKILTGKLDPDRLPDLIARCHWCNTVVGRCYGQVPTCWHMAARMLLEQGLRPLELDEIREAER